MELGRHLLSRSTTTRANALDACVNATAQRAFGLHTCKEVPLALRSVDRQAALVPSQGVVPLASPLANEVR